MLLMWDQNERVESRMTPRFRTSGDGEVEEPYMTRARSQTFLRSGAGATTMSSVLLMLSFRGLEFIQVLISCRKLLSCMGES